MLNPFEIMETIKMVDNVMHIKVSENPVISEVMFDGNDKVDDKMLESEIRLAPRSTYSRAKVQDDVRRILEVYKRSGRYATVVNPEIIVIGGGVSKAGDVLLDYIVKNYKPYVFRGSRETKFALATLGNDAGIYGAARLVIA